MDQPGVRELMEAVDAEHRAARGAGMQEAVECGDWDSYLLWHGSHERLGAFVDLLRDQELEDADYWRLLASVWIGHDFVYHSLAVWRMLFGSPRPDREHLMSEAERAKLAGLPERVTVYRGFAHPPARSGIAWTLDAERAEWFARRFESLSGTAWVATVTVHASRIIAVFDERNEDEVIVPNLRGYRSQVAAVG